MEKTYSVILTASGIKNLLYEAGILAVRAETHINIRTEKERVEVIRHFTSLGMIVVLIVPYKLKPGEFAESI